MKALLVGGNGYIGRALHRELDRRNIQHYIISRNVSDYTNHEEFEKCLKAINPALVINCAGATGHPNIDWCQSHKPETLLANVILPLTIAHTCNALDIPVAQISSGCIYNGPAPNMGGWTEADEPNFCWSSNPPSSFYSGSKAFMEERLKNFRKLYLWRIRMPFDEVDHPKNLISKLLTYRAIYDSPPNSMSNLGDLAFACIQLWESGAPYGTYNIVNPGCLTNRQVVDLIQRILKPDRKYDMWTHNNGFYAEYAKAPRSNCILSTAKLAKAGVQLAAVAGRMAECMDRWKSK